MSTPIMLVVLLGALLHASWNVLAKFGGDALIDTTLILLGGSVLALLALPLLPAPAPASWPFIATSSLLQVGYFALIGAAYRSGEVSLAYPLMRGTAPLLLALMSSVVLGESLSARAACGVVIICIGVLTMALAHRRSQADWRTIAFALMNAVVIATYTLVDGVGVRRSHNAMAYTLAIFLASCVLFVPWVAWRHSSALATAVRRHWHLGLAGGACIILSYALGAVGDDARADRAGGCVARNLDFVRAAARQDRIARAAEPRARGRRIADSRGGGSATVGLMCRQSLRSQHETKRRKW